MTGSDMNTQGSPILRPAPTPKEELDSALVTLSARSQGWVDLAIEERIKLVETIHQGFPAIWDRWESISVKAKGIDNRKYGNDRDWLALAMISRIHTVVLRSLRDIKRHGVPEVPGGYRLRPDGRVVASVFPDTFYHKLVFMGTTVEVLLEPGIGLDQAKARQAASYRQANRPGKVALVLGAGNASALPVSDTFHKLFHDLRVVILKLNPVNAYIGPLLEECYHPLINLGFLKIVYGGVYEGNYLVHHPLVDEIQMTGSDKTFEAIVFGTGEDGRRRKAEGQPVLSKPIQGELGCITPWIIVPGSWKKSDVYEQAAKMAYWMVYLDGYLCFAPRLLVMQERWPLRGLFLEALVDALARVETVEAYYPGSLEKQRTFVESHPESIQVGGELENHIPWTVIPGLDPAVKDDICFREESFSGLCGEVAIDAPTVPEFLERAVDFLNNNVWGTLSTTIVVKKESLKVRKIKQAVTEAENNLRYGTVALNAPGTWGMQTMMGPWGAFPGSQLTDIQSGKGWVANYLMLHRPEKTIVKAPFSIRPNPFLGTAKDLDKFAKKLTEFEMNPNLRTCLGVLWGAVRTIRFSR